MADPVSVGTSTATGAVVGGLIGVAAIAAAPILLPGIGLAALGATGLALVGAIPWLPAAAGAYVGYKRGVAKNQ